MLRCHGRDSRNEAAIDGDCSGVYCRTLGRGFRQPWADLSVLGAYLAWSLICAEVLFTAAKKRYAKGVCDGKQEQGAAAAFWLTNIVVQLFIISTYWSQDAFSLMLNLTSVMSLIPYLFVAAYGVLISRRGEGFEVQPEGRKRDLIVAGLAVIYTIFMILPAASKFILLSAILLRPEHCFTFGQEGSAKGL